MSEDPRAGAAPVPETRRGWRRIRHWLRPRIGRPLSRLAVALLPRLYVAYMRLVFATSRIEDRDIGNRARRICEQHDGCVALLWHEEVFGVAYAYGVHAGLRIHTLASAGVSGDIVTRILELCHFRVFRGGSTSHRSRRRPAALLAMVRHMRDNPRVLYGITVDGSKGPVYRMKPGGLLIAARCGKPVLLARLWTERCLRLPTWDRMAIPLPWNVIRFDLRGPYHVADAARDPSARLRILRALEAELVDMAAQSYAAAGRSRPTALQPRGHAARETEVRSVGNVRRPV